jgi:hypothetical protein
MVTPVVLLATLVATALAVADVLRGNELGPRTAAIYLLLFTLLFLVRVAGQLLVSDQRCQQTPFLSRASGSKRRPPGCDFPESR